MIALKKTKATNLSDHHTISLITHKAKIVASVLRRRLKGISRMYLEKIILDFEEEK